MQRTPDQTGGERTVTSAPVNFWDSIEAHSRLEEIWVSYPLVRARVNRRISGNPHTWPTTWLLSQIRQEPRLVRTVSIGSGLGALERDLIRLDLVERVIGIDVSPVCVDASVRAAAEAGMGERISYRCADAWAEIASARNLDAVFFHASLHHFDRLDEMAALLRRALRLGGLLYLDEYVGPSRDEWRLAHQLRWNWHYYHLPRSVRRVGRVRPPINLEDPTEAIASSRIRTAIRGEFELLHERGYGGNLLSVIYPNLRRPGHDPPSPRADFDAAVTRLLDEEDRMLGRGEQSYNAVILATPRR